jgi:MarR family transcriptional regulator, organic hydroperoxide resistance regulator
MQSARPSPSFEPTSTPAQETTRSSAPLTTNQEELLSDGGDDAFRALVHDLLAFSARIREIRDVLGSLVGLKGPAYTALISIAHLQRHGEVTVTSVSQHLNVSQPFATAEIGKLVAEGLVDKARSTVDRRSVSLTVTDRGHDLLAGLAPEQRVVNDTLFASLDRKSFESLAAIMPALVADADHTLKMAAASDAETGVA